jgi:hypothetical protein
MQHDVAADVVVVRWDEPWGARGSLEAFRGLTQAAARREAVRAFANQKHPIRPCRPLLAL